MSLLSFGGVYCSACEVVGSLEEEVGCWASFALGVQPDIPTAITSAASPACTLLISDLFFFLLPEKDTLSCMS